MFLLDFTFLINTFVANLKSSAGCKIMASLMHSSCWPRSLGLLCRPCTSACFCTVYGGLDSNMTFKTLGFYSSFSSPTCPVRVCPAHYRAWKGTSSHNACWVASAIFSFVYIDGRDSWKARKNTRNNTRKMDRARKSVGPYPEKLDPGPKARYLENIQKKN